MGLSFGFGWIGTVVCQVKELVLFPDINGVELFNEVDDLPIKVANFLTKFLREHQREGVRFMFRCVAGIHEGLEDHHGCILAGSRASHTALRLLGVAWQPSVLQLVGSRY